MEIHTLLLKQLWEDCERAYKQDINNIKLILNNIIILEKEDIKAIYTELERNKKR